MDNFKKITVVDGITIHQMNQDAEYFPNKYFGAGEFWSFIEKNGNISVPTTFKDRHSYYFDSLSDILRAIAVYIENKPPKTSEEKLELVKKEWDLYRTYLKNKYPSCCGEEWKFNCPYLKKIDEILRK